MGSWAGGVEAYALLRFAQGTARFLWLLVPWASLLLLASRPPPLIPRNQFELSRNSLKQGETF